MNIINAKGVVINLNDKEITYEGNVSIINGQIFVNGKYISSNNLDNKAHITINVIGPVERIENVNTVTVKGDVKGNITSKKTTIVSGDCHGNISSGNSTKVSGNCRGNIESGNSTLVKGNCSGKIISGNKTEVRSNFR